MTIPSATTTEIDGSLGVLPPSGGRMLAIAGPSSSGPIDTPAAFGRTQNVIGTFGGGPLVEAMCYAIEKYGRPVVGVRTASTTTGSAGAVTHTGTGTSVVTVDSGPDPIDDYEVVFAVVTGGTIGTAGATFRYSLDGGRTYSPTIALGTANTYAIPGSGITLNFAAGTLVAGDTFAFLTTAPCWTPAELTAALASLRTTSIEFDGIEIVGPIDGSAFDAIETAIAAMVSAGKHTWWMGHARMPNAGESASAYLTAQTAIFGSRSSVYGAVTYGSEEIVSAVSGRVYRRPISFSCAPMEQGLSEEQNSAWRGFGPRAGVSIVDANGNPKHHDETVWPGPDDARFYVNRTWPRKQGVYVNLPRLLSPSGSDFQLITHRRVMNLARAALDDFFADRLNQPIAVDPKTGFILETEALEIEAGALARLRSVLLAKPKASGVTFKLSRNDNVLSTQTLTAQWRILPLSYPRWIQSSAGFVNPALQTQTV